MNARRVIRTWLSALLWALAVVLGPGQTAYAETPRTSNPQFSRDELLSNAGNQQRNDAAVMIQEQLKKVGIRATPRILEFATLLDLTEHGRFAAAVEGFGMDTSLDLTSYFHTLQENGDRRNSARYSNPEVDRLIEQSMAVTNIADAKPTLDRIQEILHHDQPYTFLWESQRMPAINRRLRDVKPTMLFALTNMKEWWIEPHP